MSPLEYVLLFLAGAVASGVNAVAGGGTLLSFPVLVALGIPPKVSNATNALALWPGSLSGAFGFINLLPKTKHHFLPLLAPTVLGATAGAFLLDLTPGRLFDWVIPPLILVASLLLLFQPKVKNFLLGEHKVASPMVGVVLQFLVALYGGYFGAGMGIMMLAAFALYMEGTIHELNAVKNWLGLFINFVASVVFITKGLIAVGPAVALGIGSIIGGFIAARLSQKLQPEKLRLTIAAYGLIMAGYFVYRAIAAG